MSQYQIVSDIGPIISKPASMPTRGMYHPTIIKCSDITGWQAPYEWMVLCSTDHVGGAGGVWAFLCPNDPTTGWVDYDTAVAAGHFDYLPSKPAANPIYVNTVDQGSQTETPCANIVNGVVYMTTHNDGGPHGQTTNMATSTDGINFTTLDNVLVYDRDDWAGNGHTGYFRWAENVVPTIPYSYIGYSILGGGGSATTAMWGTNDLTQPWDLITPLAKPKGRVLQGLAIYSNQMISARTHPKNFVLQDDGTVLAIGTLKQEGVSGAGLGQESAVQYLLDASARIPVSTADNFFPNPAHSNPHIEIEEGIEHNGKKYLVYRGAIDSSEAHVCLVEYEIASGSLPLIDPEMPSYDVYNFVGESSLPEGVEQLTESGSISFTENGLELTIPAGQSDGFILPEMLSSQGLIDVSWDRMRLTEEIEWLPNTGFVKDYIRGSALGYPNMLMLKSVEDPNTANIKRTAIAQKLNGVESVLETSQYDTIGVTSTWDGATQRCSYGLRWMPSKNLAYILNFDQERGRSDEVAPFPQGRYTPFVEIHNPNATPITVIIEGIKVGTAGNFTYNWSLTSNPTGSNVTIADPTAKNFDLTPDLAGVYSLSLTTTDGVNTSTIAARSLSVNTVNQPPTANAGPDQSVAAATQFTLDGTGSLDSDGTIVEWRWTQTAGDTVTLNLDDPARPTATSPSKTTAQRLTFQLITVDDEGAVSSQGSVNIDVAAVVQNDVLNIIDKISFTFEFDGLLTAFPGRANRETFRLKPSDPTGLILEDGYFDFSQNNVAKVEISVLDTTGVKIISSDSDAVIIDGSKLHARMGDIPVKSSTKEFEPTISVFVGDDTMGVVMTAPGLAGGPKVKYFATTARAV